MVKRSKKDFFKLTTTFCLGQKKRKKQQRFYIKRGQRIERRFAAEAKALERARAFNSITPAAEDNKEERVVGEMEEDGSRSMPSSQEQEATLKKKYGGIVPKKPPLISKDHERAYFDSADWALGKQGVEKPKGPLEALRPKLQPTQQQTRYRKSPCAPAGGEDGENTASEEPTST